LIQRGVRPMDPSDIRYILALTRLDHLRIEYPETRAQFLATISKLTSQRASMRTLETDLQTPASASFSSLSREDVQLLYLGRELIEALLKEYYSPLTSNAAITYGSSTTASSKPAASARDSTFDPEE
jgi:hypothetical protein